jgi:hypothetical protein
MDRYHDNPLFHAVDAEPGFLDRAIEEVVCTAAVVGPIVGYISVAGSEDLLLCQRSENLQLQRSCTLSRSSPFPCHPQNLVSMLTPVSYH